MPEGVLRLLERLGCTPAYVLDARYDIVAWNAAAEVFPDIPVLPPGLRNVLRMWMSPGDTVCGTPAGEERESIRQVAADLREAAVRYPSGPELHQLIEDLSEYDPDFASGWSRHDVRVAQTLRKRVEHSELGTIGLDCETLRIPSHDQWIMLYTAEPGSPDEDKLARIEAAHLDRV